MVVRGDCHLIFQLTITITVDISVDDNNCPNDGQLLKWWKEETLVRRLYGMTKKGLTGGEKSFAAAGNETANFAVTFHSLTREGASERAPDGGRGEKLLKVADARTCDLSLSG